MPPPYRCPLHQGLLRRCGPCAQRPHSLTLPTSPPPFPPPLFLKIASRCSRTLRRTSRCCASTSSPTPRSLPALGFVVNVVRPDGYFGSCVLASYINANKMTSSPASCSVFPSCYFAPCREGEVRHGWTSFAALSTPPMAMPLLVAVSAVCAGVLGRWCSGLEARGSHCG